MCARLPLLELITKVIRQPRIGIALEVEMGATFYRDVFSRCCDRNVLSAVRGFLSDNGIEPGDADCGFLGVRHGYCTAYDNVLLTISEKGFNHRLLEDPECFQLLLGDF